MSEIFAGTRNTRFILKDSKRYLRSDVPVYVSDKECAWLIENNILTVIDLREKNEQISKPCPLAENPAFRYYSFAVSGGNAVPESPEKVAVSYIEMADDRMDMILDFIMNADTNVLFFCNAGKDRTGVASAMILSRLGYDREYIIRDYMKSADNLKSMLEAFAIKSPEIDIEVITPHREYMEKFLTWLSRKGNVK
ncbi:MAG: tyrosine-protein phosphatase [Ruminococcus sp.]|nr:tyrosine-protein phosphatase [Ruminococcus sp.]